MNNKDITNEVGKVNFAVDAKGSIVIIVNTEFGTYQDKRDLKDYLEERYAMAKDFQGFMS